MSLEALTQDQKDFYNQNGYLVLPERIPAEIVQDIREEIAKYQDQARRRYEGLAVVRAQHAQYPAAASARRKRSANHRQISTRSGSRDCCYP